MTDKQLINLDGEASRELSNDVVSITFEATKQGKVAADVQKSVREAVKAALDVVHSHLVDDEVEVTTDNFQIQPTYTKDKISGYKGSASVTLKGTDTAKIAQLASAITTMVVSGSYNSLSRKLKMSIHAELMKEAIADFSSKADAITAAFGYKGWEIHTAHVSVSNSDRFRSSGKAMAIGGAMESSSGVTSVESGKSTITANVRGGIILFTKKKA